MMKTLMRMQVCVQHIQSFTVRRKFNKAVIQQEKKKVDHSDEVLNLVATKLQSCEGRFCAYDKQVTQELESLPNEMAMFYRKLLTK
jgi:hypothetical protein